MPSMVLGLKCQHRGCGALLPRPDWDGDISCICCGRGHTPEGELLIPEVRYFADISDRTQRPGIDIPERR